MPEGRKMVLGTRKAVGPLALFALIAGGLSACGSGTDATTTPPAPPPVSASTADHLAKLSNRIATDLDAGETCSAAMAADDLKAAVAEADLANTIRPGVEAVASRLVDEVNCPPPPPPPQPEPKPEKKKPKPDENKQGDQKHKPPGHGGVPPGHAKLEGEQ
jgi:hypothetical protein